ATPPRPTSPGPAARVPPAAARRPPSPPRATPSPSARDEVSGRNDMLSYTPEEEAFRADLRAWLAAHLPRTPPPEDEDERRAFQRTWQRELAAAGWVGIQWPRAHGGRGATLKEQIIFTEGMGRARAPEILDAGAVNVVGSVLIDAGSPAQQARHLPRILPADDVWCLGFSEPNAGSDLASLRCRARHDGDHWIVDGQKVWSSKAHFADWLLLLARTDP